MPMLVMAAPSELLGLEHRPAEIHEQKHRDDAGDDVIEHDRLLRPVARAGDAPEREEADATPTTTIEQVKHGLAPCASDGLTSEDEVAGDLERAPPPLDARRQPAVLAADQDERMRLECERETSCRRRGRGRHARARRSRRPRGASQRHQSRLARGRQGAPRQAAAAQSGSARCGAARPSRRQARTRRARPQSVSWRSRV